MVNCRLWDRSLSYRQDRELVAAKQSPCRVAAPDMPVESPKTKCSSSKSWPLWGTGCSSNTSTPKCPDSTSTKKLSHPQESTPDHQAVSTGLQLLEAQPLALSHHSVSRIQMKGSLWGRLRYSQHHSPHQL